MPYTNIEYSDMLYCYGEARGNSSEAARQYARRYPNRVHPNRLTFERVFRNIRETGSVRRRDGAGRPTRRDSENILAAFDADPCLSTRRGGALLNVSHTTVHRDLQQDQRYPYHLTAVQHLLDRDMQPRLDFCNWFIQTSREEPRFPRRIIYTDEATFTRSGVFNYHNNHRWAEINPNAIRERGHQYQFKVNVWLGMLGKYLLRPIFIPERFNGASFLAVLENNLPDLLEDIPLVDRENTFFQMDGCPAHNCRDVTAWLNTHYGERWIGKNGPIKWPARSPDLTPMDFYVWGQLKALVYAEPIESREQLVQRITDKCAEMALRQREVLAAADAVLKRARMCRTQGGRHIENYL